MDKSGNTLLEYLWDLEIERSTWHKAAGITGGWYSTPLEPKVTQSITEVPIPMNPPYPGPTEVEDTPAPQTPYP